MIRRIRPLPAGFLQTPEWHQGQGATAADDPYLAQQHDNLAKLIERRRRRAQKAGGGQPSVTLAKTSTAPFQNCTPRLLPPSA